jgi:hypothetical protein
MEPGMGPSSAIFRNANAVATDVEGLVEGKYEFELRVRDNVAFHW